MEEVMRIAISSTGRDLDANLDPRFGRADYYIILDSETMDFYAVENSQNFNSPQGAGIQAARIIADQDIDTLITGHCGPKAFKVLQNAGVKVITGAGGRVADAVDQLKKGKLGIAAGADVEGHWV
jgi:predicted Fe-Mo cluster-binding NifX family protein